jgi:uncharacterized protein
MTDPNHRFEQIAEFVQQRLHEVARQKQNPKLDPVYRWEHTLRVSNYGKKIAEAEGANVELSVAGCLLHDVAVFDLEDWRDHGRLGAQIIRPFLLDLGYSPAEMENICYSVAVHVDGKADFDQPATLEAEVVSDADNVDRFGAYRSVLWCTVEVEGYDGLIAKLKQRLKTLEDYRQRRIMGTDTGHLLFNQQLDRQIAFFKTHIEEGKLTTLPQL